MRQSLGKQNPSNPVANRTPSPDTCIQYRLDKTKEINIKMPQKSYERVPLLQQITSLAEENRKLREEVLNSASHQYKKELEAKNKWAIDNQQRSKKINLTINEGTERKFQRPPSRAKTNIQNQIEDLKAKVVEISKQNSELKKSLLERAIISSEPSADLQLLKLREQLLDNVKLKLLKFQKDANEKMYFISEKARRLEDTLNKTKEKQQPESRQKLSVISPYKRQTVSTNKELSTARDFQTPQSFDPDGRRNSIGTLQDQLSASKNNIIQLIKQNETLTAQCYQYKKSYDDLLMNQKSSSAYQKLQKQIADLTLKNSSLQKAFIKVNKQPNQDQIYLQKKIEEQQNVIEQMNDLLKRANGEVSQLKKRLLSNSTLELHNHVNTVEQENGRLADQNKRLKEEISKNKELSSFGRRSYNESQSGAKEELKKKDDQILKLQQSLRELQRGSQPNIASNITSLKEKIEDADKTIQLIENINSKNRNQVESCLRELESVRGELDNITFSELEVGLRDFGYKYKNLIDQKIAALRSLDNKKIQLNRLNEENEKNKLIGVEMNTKYINEKSQRQRLESMVHQQQIEVEILQEQINSLNNLLNQYIHKQSVQSKLKTESDGSRIKELDDLAIESESQKNILQLKELERQFKMVSGRLQDITRKMNYDLGSSREGISGRVTTSRMINSRNYDRT